jgi:hypothetical protein
MLGPGQLLFVSRFVSQLVSVCGPSYPSLTLYGSVQNRTEPSDLLMCEKLCI